MSEAEEAAWLEASAADLGVALDELERDVAPEELRRWLAAFEPSDS